MVGRKGKTEENYQDVWSKKEGEQQRMQYITAIGEDTTYNSKELSLKVNVSTRYYKYDRNLGPMREKIVRGGILLRIFVRGVSK